MYYITSNDGTKIAVYDYNPQGKQTIFLIHGWPLSHQIFEYQINLLTDCGYRVVAVDLRGFGKSDTPASNVYGYISDSPAALSPAIYFGGLLHGRGDCLKVHESLQWIWGMQADFTLCRRTMLCTASGFSIRKTYAGGQ